MKELIKKLIAWFTFTAIPALKLWFAMNWMIVVNYAIIFVAYSIVYNVPQVVFAEFLLGIWLFASAAIGGYKWFTKKK